MERERVDGDSMYGMEQREVSLPATSIRFSGRYGGSLPVTESQQKDGTIWRKAGAGRFVSLVYGFDARWLLQQRDGDGKDGSPKKGKTDVTRGGPGSLDHLQISDLCIIETKKEHKTSSSRRESEQAFSRSPIGPTGCGKRERAWLAAARAEVAGSRAGETTDPPRHCCCTPDAWNTTTQGPDF